MLPFSLHLPASIVLLAGGLLACFAGYRLFRLVLGVYGFLLGALFASSLVSPASGWSMLLAALVGGVIGAAVLTFGYFVGVALVGAGLGALVANAVWTQQGPSQPPALLLLLFVAVGVVAALFFQRYVIIVGTAFGGAWTALVGGLSMFGTRHAADATSTWIVYPFNPYPFNPATGQPFVLVVAWLVLGALGTAVQLKSGVRRA